MTLFKSSLAKIATLSAVGFAIAPAHANYDAACMELLRAPGERALAMDVWRESWTPALKRLAENRAFSDVEFEVFMDTTHSLALVATLDDGKKVALPSQRGALTRLGTVLRRNHIVAALYLPDALKKIAEVYKEACRILARIDCDVYDQYMGLNATGLRPFTPAEEHVLKWCTFHMTSQPAMAEMYRRMQVPEREVIRLNNQAAESRRLSALHVLVATFNDTDVAALYGRLVRPHIDASFESTLQLYRGRRH